VKRLAAASFAVVVLALLPARADTLCPPPRCLTIAVPVTPGLKVPDNHVRVILPVGYKRARSYPVLYLLHGAGDTYASWTQNTDLLAYSASYRVIIVMPDSGKNGNAGWYADWIDGSRQWESFHIHDVIPYIERTFHGNGKRAIAGLSMGGYGAMYYAASHPGMFEAAAEFSGVVDITYGAPVSGVAFNLLRSRYGTPGDQVWGNQVTDLSNWQAHNPTDLVAGLKETKLFLACGDGLPGGTHENPSNPGGYALENGVFQMNISFVRALTLAGIPHTDRFYGSGQHSWPYWQDDLHWALPQIMQVLG
jgi:S-formylglutathione hydrolase FrmB